MGLTEVVPGIWRGESDHPDWTEATDWPQSVAWHVVSTADGAVVIDPLPGDSWEDLDAVVDRLGGCRAVVRSVFWHERSCRLAADRYEAQLLALGGEARAEAFDLEIESGQPVAAGLIAFATSRGDEVCLWAAEQRTLLAADVLIRAEDGQLRRCPDSWLRFGPAPVQRALGGLLDYPIEHVLVAHGPVRLGDGAAELKRALAG